MSKIEQAEINIGTVGHVDHGKTSIVKSLTGEWVDKHSEEIKRGITIRLGYSDAKIFYCKQCKKHCTKKTCPEGHKTEYKRKISFVDCPGHENLMAVTISGASLMDGAILVIAANEPCPQPQTQEHLNALDVVQIKDLIIVQNKLDLVTKEEAEKHYEQIKKFIKGTVAENAPIIPMAANYNLNLNYLVDAIEENFKTPNHDKNKPLKMYIARSFDINKPGTEIKDLCGGVIGGSIVQGQIKKGEEIEINPGFMKKDEYVPIKTKISSISIKEGVIEKAGAGGLVALGARIDPAQTKNDKMIGQVAGKPGTLPATQSDLKLKYNEFKRVVGEAIPQLEINDMIIVNAGTAMSPATVTKIKKNYMEARLKRPFCIWPGEKIGISKRARSKWSLVGYGEIE